MKDNPPVVFVVDDDDSVRMSLRLLLKSVGLSVTTFSSAEAFLADCTPSHPGCLLLDIRMPGMDGLAMQRELRSRGMTLPVIFISGHGDIPMAVEALHGGAFDFLQKPFGDQQLIECVRRAIAKDREERTTASSRERIRSHIESLTPRERDVLKLMSHGKPNKVMAAELGLSQRTVEIHRAHVMDKMAAASIADLVRMLVELEGPRSSGPR